jgi:hypothetical protein
VPDDTGVRSAWLAALEGARERLLSSYARYPYATGLHNEAVLTDEEREAKRAKKARKAAEMALKAGTFTGFVDDDDEKRMTKIIQDAAAKAVTDALEADAKRVDPAKRPDVVTSGAPTDDEGKTDHRSDLPDYLRSATVRVRDSKDNSVTTDKIVKMPMAPGGLRGHSVEADRVLDEHVANALVKAISVNRFPRNFDAGDFCVSRYCMAREMFPYEGQRAYGKYAPKESQYYQALEDYGKEFKALGEYTSGQDGGFLAPEIWTNVFFDISGAACR